MRVQTELEYFEPEPPLKFESIIKFQQRLFGDMSGALTGLAAYLGDGLGLFGSLSEVGPVTAEGLAHRCDTCPEMTAEWLRLMVGAGYVEYDATTSSFSLSQEHAMVIANDQGPLSVVGGIQQIGGFAAHLPAIMEAFREKRGVAQSSYPKDLWDGMERMSATWFEHELVDSWIVALPAVRDKLVAGCAVLDVGCGSGRALLRMAKSFPASRFTGYDVSAIAIERASRKAHAAGVAARTSFEVRDVLKGVPADFDLVTAFDSLHDMADPVEGLRGLARGLRDDGVLLVLELAVGGSVAEESGPIGVIIHATKLFYNVPVALEAFGEARGNIAFTEAHMRKLCRDAGLLYEGALPVRNPLHKLYVIRNPSY
jgi:ubiquinone/menaquinone biosynthesis C-methylase UbiE